MKIIITTAAILVLMFTGVALAAPEHGFRDVRAPQEASRIINTLPNADRFTCHWKVRKVTIGCVGLLKGVRAQVFMWSEGSKRIYYHVCEDGVCGKNFKTQHVFGRPY